MSDSQMLQLPMDRKLYFTKQVKQESIADLTKDIISINESDSLLKKTYKIYGLKYKPKPIEIYIDSYGGFVYQCFGVLSVIQNSKTPIHTIVTGCAMSCGFLMLICGHKRFAHKLSTPLYHQVSSDLWGKFKDLEEELTEVKRLQDKLEEITLERTNIPKKKLKKVFKSKRDWYMSAEEALENGVIDEII